MEQFWQKVERRHQNKPKTILPGTDKTKKMKREQSKANQGQEHLFVFINDEDKKMDRWREYFNKLLNKESDELTCGLQELVVEDQIESPEEEKIGMEDVKKQSEQ